MEHIDLASTMPDVAKNLTARLDYVRYSQRTSSHLNCHPHPPLHCLRFSLRPQLRLARSLSTQVLNINQPVFLYFTLKWTASAFNPDRGQGVKELCCQYMAAHQGFSGPYWDF